MAEHEGTQTVQASPQALFDYLSDVRNLPRYFTRMTSAEPGEGEEVRVEATIGGQTVRGEAWFRVDEAARRIEWGSEGPNDYHGWLEVSGDTSPATVEVHVSTSRVANGEVDEGIAETLGTIKRLVEDG